MVNAFWAALGIACTLTLVPVRVEACKPPELRGRVKSVITTEAVNEPARGFVGQQEPTSRIDISRDGTVVDMTYLTAQSGQAGSRSTAYLENGKVVRAVDVANGKTISTTNCVYDTHGRLIEATTQSILGERSSVENYEYSAGLIRRRIKSFAGSKIITQTLDDAGRVVKEVVVDETNSKVEQIHEFTYNANRVEQCTSSSSNAPRQCRTVVRDDHGNDVEVSADGETTKNSFEYDSSGNWILKKSAFAKARIPPVERIVRRKIEYW